MVGMLVFTSSSANGIGRGFRVDGVSGCERFRCRGFRVDGVFGGDRVRCRRASSDNSSSLSLICERGTGCLAIVRRGFRTTSWSCSRCPMVGMLVFTSSSANGIGRGFRVDGVSGCERFRCRGFRVDGVFGGDRVRCRRASSDNSSSLSLICERGTGCLAIVRRGFRTTSRSRSRCSMGMLVFTVFIVILLLRK